MSNGEIQHFDSEMKDIELVASTCVNCSKHGASDLSYTDYINSTCL